MVLCDVNDVGFHSLNHKPKQFCKRHSKRSHTFSLFLSPSDIPDDDIPVFTEEPLSVVQKLGGSVTLRCSARPTQARISWRLNGRELFVDGDEAELGVVMQPDALFIPSLSNGTLGRYQCVARTGAGARASMPANVTAASEYTTY